MLMRAHRAEELNLQHEVEKHEQMIEALRNGNPEKAAATVSRIASGFQAHVRTESQAAEPKPPRKTAKASVGASKAKR